MERPRMTKAEHTALGRKKRSAKRVKLGQASSKTKGIDRRMFSLRLAPTKEQKLYLQRAFGITCLAKRLAYKHLQDQRAPITPAIQQKLRTQICTEDVTRRVYPDDEEEEEEDPKQKKGRRRGWKNETRPNEFLPLRDRRRLFESHLKEQEQRARQFFARRRWRKGARKFKIPWTTPLWRQPIPSDVRKNAVLQFCQAIASTQAQTEERQLKWDTKMEAHQRWLERERAFTDEQVLAEMTGERISRKALRKRTAAESIQLKKATLPSSSSSSSSCKHPPRGERPAMARKQVKPTDRNSPVQTFSIDAKSNQHPPWSASWDDGFVRLRTGLKVKLWGCPSRRRRELIRLTARMHDRERGTRQRVTIKYDHGRYYLQVQCLLPGDRYQQRITSLDSPVRVAALDPGIRTFQGLADTAGRFGEIGEGQVERLIRVAKKASRIQSHVVDKDLRGPANKKKRHKARKRLLQKNLKCRDMKNDGHWKAVRSLCERYDHILIPKFHCSTMKRFLHKTSTRQLVHWSHFQFRQRLKHKADELGAKVSEVSEHSTSITCSRCLWIEESFKGNSSKTFECRKCGLQVDRDRNGARNILLMNVERHVGRLEPLPVLPFVSSPATPALITEKESECEDENEEDDECQGWMWLGDGLPRARRR